MLFSLLAIGCADVEKPHDHHHDHEHELMTTVELVFTDADGNATTSIWADPENDGDPVIDDIMLGLGDYSLAFRVLNELEVPTEDVTPEIYDEADEHQVFFTGSAVEADDDGLPLGLINDVSVLSDGTGELTVTLRHMPPESGTPVKVDGLAEEVYEEGFTSIPGANDISVTFPVMVETN